MSATRKLRILCVHGVGGHPAGGQWEKDWTTAITSSLTTVNPEVEPVVRFMHYDDLFEKYPITFMGTIEAVAKLTASALTRRSFAVPRGLGDSIRWSAGMVVKWVEDERFRLDTRARLQARIDAFSPEDPVPPDVICAHSLGSLVCYDTFTANPSPTLKDISFVSLGSQIANPFVAGNFLAGRVEPLQDVKFWYHLYNREDDVFTAPIYITAPNFRQVDAYFDIPGITDHDAVQYLSHTRAVEQVWSRIALERTTPRLFRGVGTPRTKASLAKPNRRALLVGINDYPSPEDRLEGCVNDVFLMSALLQEWGFPPEDIRVVLNERATADGIRERIHWLLEGATTGERVLYYSGHGAQLPTYGQADTVDRMDETLVPYDFDWSSERSITDDWFHDLYSNLPYDLRFLVMFDCCHSGGMTRDGAVRVRGLSPPDDIRHRALRWDTDLQMWKDRDVGDEGRAFLRRYQSAKKTRLTTRLGFGLPVRSVPQARYRRRKRELGHKGPYLPLLVYACQEDQYAYEYLHGSIPHGAFTYSLVKHVRERLPAGAALPTWEQLVRAVGRDLVALRYNQAPKLVGPKDMTRTRIPARPTGRKAGGRRATIST